MNLRTLVFLARKDLLKDIKILLLILLAIGSGALAIIPLNGLLGGFTKNMSDTTIDVSIGHVIISPPKGEQYIENAISIKKRVENLSGISGSSSRLLERAIIKKADESELILLRGIQPEEEARTTSIAQKIKEGSFLVEKDQNGFVVGETLASELNLKVSDSVTLIFSNNPKGRVPRAMPVGE